MRRLHSIARDERGSPAIEFAIAVPVLVSIIYGIAQLGLIYEANAGIQHALGEAARYATLYDADKTTRVHTEDEILARLNAKLFGKGSGTFTPKYTDNGNNSVELEVKYSKKLDFLFMPGPTVTLTRTKTVYMVIPS
ncbi:MAG: TadE/TadG family type IV pilus assembly protein [Sphingomicrobium sp.]